MDSKEKKLSPYDQMVKDMIEASRLDPNHPNFDPGHKRNGRSMKIIH